MTLRQRFSSFSLGLKLALACAGVELILLSFLLGAVLLVSITQIERYEDLRDHEVRFLLTRSFADPLVRQDASELLDMIERFSISPDITFLEVSDLRGRVIGKRGQEADGARSADIEVGGQRYGQVRFALSSAHLAAEQRIVFSSLATGGFLVIILSVGVFFAIGQILTMRLRLLSGCARNLSTGNFNICVSTDGNDEVAQLGQAFSAMQDALRQRIEELDRARTQAEQASQAKSNFLANISHELRTPLNAVIGFSTLAMNEAQSPRQRHHLQRTIDGANRLNDVITDILDITRLESGQVRADHRSFRIEDFEGKLVTLYGAEADDKSLEFTSEIPLELAEEPLIGDPAMIERVLEILLSNALKFTQAGKVTLAIRQLSTSERDMQVCFEVRDTGIGIAQVDQERIFELFEQADNSSTRGYGGMGVGLHIAKIMVSKLGGQLKVESSPGKGSRFWFELILARAPA